MGGDGGERQRGTSLFVFLRSRAMPLSYRCRPRRFAAGSHIVRSGDPADAAHVIVAGVARAERMTGGGLWGRDLRAGDILGEDKVLAGRAHELTVRAVTDVRTISASREELLRALLDAPGSPSALRALLPAA